MSSRVMIWVAILSMVLLTIAASAGTSQRTLKPKTTPFEDISGTLKDIKSALIKVRAALVSVNIDSLNDVEYRNGKILEQSRTLSLMELDAVQIAIQKIEQKQTLEGHFELNDLLSLLDSNLDALSESLVYLTNNARAVDWSQGLLAARNLLSTPKGQLFLASRRTMRAADDIIAACR